MQTGTLLAQRYRIDATLGEGGMGVVFKAQDTLLDRAVAIKTLSPHLIGEEGLKRLLREAQSAAKLTHPNIVAIYDVIEDAGSWAIVMEVIQGRTLREMYPLPLELLADVTAQVLDALDYAHTRGIVHRDIKPENVMVTEDGTVKVTDFGLARSEGRSRLTQTGLIVGTVAYIAPEQALGGELDGRTDLYALGCVLYEMVTGRRPFESEDPISVISQHVSVPPIAPRWHNKELPPDWEGVILKLMAKDPAERYASAAETRRAVQALRPSSIEEAEAAEGEVPSAALLGTVQRGRLVARDAELRELKGYGDLAISGQGQLVVLAGEPGIGKTRLAREGLIYARLRGCRVMTGACYEQEGGVPYLPFVEALQGYVRSRPAQAVAAEVGEEGSELVKILPELAEVIPGLNPSPPLEETHERLRLYDGVADFFVHLSRVSPLALFLDDIHWADGATLQLLKHLARRVRGERMLLLGAYRDVELDREHPLADALREMNRERLYQRVILRRLDPEGVRAMIATMFSLDRPSDEFVNLIHRETEGNPFFVEEVLKHLVETGAIYREAGRWERKGQKDISEIEVPQSVKEVIGRRLEQVSGACRQTLTLAAVIGKRFDFDVLVRTGDGGEDQVLDAIEEAMRSQLLSEEKVGSAVLYDFAHALIRETLYEGLSLRRRMRMHQRVGEALEAVHQGNPEAVIEDLAFHFARAPQAEVTAKAVAYALRAGEKAERVHAHEEALKFFGEAVDLLREAGREGEAADVLERMGEPTWYATGDRDKALAHLREALAYQEKSGNRLRAAEVHRKIGQICSLIGAFAEAIPHLQAALKTFEEVKKPEDIARTLVDLAVVESFSGDFPGAERDAARARELAVAQGMRVEEARATTELAYSLLMKGRWDEANVLFLRALELSEGIDSLESRLVRLRTYALMAFIAPFRGDFRQALDMLERRLKLASDGRNHPQMAVSRYFLAIRHHVVGDWVSARTLLKESLKPESHAGSVFTRLSTQLLSWLDGDWEAAREMLAEGLAEAEQEADVQLEFSHYMLLIKYSIDLEENDAAVRWSREALQALRPYQQDYPGFFPGTAIFAALALGLGGYLDEANEALARVEPYAEVTPSELRRAYQLLARAVIQAKSDAWGQALQAFEQSVTRIQGFGMAGEAAWAQWIFGRLLLAQTDAESQDRAKRLLNEALETYERIGATRFVQEIRKRLATTGG